MDRSEPIWPPDEILGGPGGDVAVSTRGATGDLPIAREATRHTAGRRSPALGWGEVRSSDAEILEPVIWDPPAESAGPGQISGHIDAGDRASDDGAAAPRVPPSQSPWAAPPRAARGAEPAPTLALPGAPAQASDEAAPPLPRGESSTARPALPSPPSRAALPATPPPPTAPAPLAAPAAPRRSGQPHLNAGPVGGRRDRKKPEAGPADRKQPQRGQAERRQQPRGAPAQAAPTPKPSRPLGPGLTTQLTVIGTNANAGRTVARLLTVTLRQPDPDRWDRAVEAISIDEEYQHAGDLLARDHGLTVVEAGSDIESPLWHRAVNESDYLIVAVNAAGTGPVAAAGLLDEMVHAGYQKAVQQALTVILLPVNRLGLTRGHEDVDAIRSHFNARTRHVAVAPFDLRPTAAARNAWHRIVNVIQQSAAVT